MTIHEIRFFLEELHLTKFQWTGKEIFCFSEDDLVFCKEEFYYDGWTRKEWERLEESLECEKPFTFSV